MNGVIVIDKPAGKSSHDVVRLIRKIPGVKKAGHTGTLDPLATGVLPICINEATKLVQFLVHDSKEYRATMLLGVETDTLDIEGRVVTRKEASVRRGDIEAVLKNCRGKMEQIPPRYSAVKFRGKTLYSWSRKGIFVECSPRKVEIHRIDLLDVQLPYVSFLVSCSKGTYIRSLCADIGEQLGCKACLAGLRRLRSGRFHEKGAMSVDDLRNLQAEDTGGHLISMVDALSGLPALYVDESSASRLRKGHQPSVRDLEGNNIPSIAAGDMVRFILKSEGLVAVGEALCDSEKWPCLTFSDRFVRIARVFNNAGE